MDFLCGLADLNVKFKLPTERVAIISKRFAKKFDKLDVEITVTEDDIDEEQRLYGNNLPAKPRGAFEITAAFRLLAEKLPIYDAAVLHSCAFSVEDRGIALAAHSGTGKTTHMLLWQTFMGEKFNIVNGDKPLIRLIDDTLYMYGSPWAGKEGLKANIRVPLTDICEIVRNEKNFTEQMSQKEGIDLLYRQVYMPFDSQARIKTLKLIEKTAQKVNFWKIHCNMDISAAQVAYNTIFGNK